MVVQRKGLVFELKEPVDFIFCALEAVVYVFLDDCSGRRIVSSVSGNEEGARKGQVLCKEKKQVEQVPLGKK